ncbi:MAG TPA: PPK2 family polyphosphate kinase [Fimbriimonas sp.]
MAYSYVVPSDSDLKLNSLDTNDNAGLGKEEGLRKLEDLAAEIGELQELLFASRQTAVLCIFQAMDAGGKDGAINRVISYVNVQSCRVAYFKAPTEEELAHDFLWRVHRQTPPKGGMTLFNRSHYEDVVAVRVRGLAPEGVWKDRYDLINDFERLLAKCETILLKFFLHVSKEEQEKRLLAREKDPRKAWKLNVEDWKERERWDEYQEAYEEAIRRCSTEYAPWRVVAADRKWFRDLAVAEALAETLRPFRAGWEESLRALGDRAAQELQEYRASR